MRGPLIFLSAVYFVYLEDGLGRSLSLYSVSCTLHTDRVYVTVDTDAETEIITKLTVKRKVVVSKSAQTYISRVMREMETVKKKAKVRGCK